LFIGGLIILVQVFVLGFLFYRRRKAHAKKGEATQ
jgi:hypothetical protein